MMDQLHWYIIPECLICVPRACISSIIERNTIEHGRVNENSTEVVQHTQNRHWTGSYVLRPVREAMSEI